MATRKASLLVLFVGVVGLGVLIFLWSKPKITPAIRLQAEQEIYSVLLADRTVSGEEITPLWDHTTLGGFQESASENGYQFVVDGLPALERATLIDFQDNNLKSYPIKPFLSSTNIVLVNPQDNQQVWWVSFSRIGLNPSVNQALVMVELHAACASGVCEYGTGNFALLRKVAGRWIIQEYLGFWHTHPT